NLVTTATSNRFFLSNYDLDVWIDAGHLVRRFKVAEFTRPQPKDTPPVPGETVEETIEFFDFGVAAKIEAPPPDQVTEIPEAPQCGSAATSSTTSPGLLF